MYLLYRGSRRRGLKVGEVKTVRDCSIYNRKKVKIRGGNLIYEVLPSLNQTKQVTIQVLDLVPD